MKKIKFLSGVGAAFAFAAVALTTTFTSCEKENLTVNVEQEPAKVVFIPTVIDAATNVDVTSMNPSIEYAGATVIENKIEATESNKSITGGTVTVTATLNGVTGSAKVEYPSLSAGQVSTVSVVILLNSQFEGEIVGDWTASGVKKEEWGNAGNVNHTHDNKLWAENATDYYVEYTASWNKTAEPTLKSVDIYVASSQLEIADKLPAVTNASSMKELFRASAWCLYNAVYTIEEGEAVYEYRSKAAPEQVVAKVVYVNPIYRITAAHTEVPFPGHESAYEHGHGHGNNPNAGGGIILAD